jgi:hypothetical protein
MNLDGPTEPQPAHIEEGDVGLPSQESLDMMAPASTPPPPPQVSPDGRFWWDGKQWLPMPSGTPSSLANLAVPIAVPVAPIAPEPSVVVIRNYKGNSHTVQQRYSRDAQQMAAHGYEPMGQSYIQGRTGCMRFILLGGIGALVFRPADTLTVTYKRKGS